MKRRKNVSPQVNKVIAKFIQIEDDLISCDINYQNISLPERYQINYLNKLQLSISPETFNPLAKVIISLNNDILLEIPKEILLLRVNQIKSSQITISHLLCNYRYPFPLHLFLTHKLNIKLVFFRPIILYRETVSLLVHYSQDLRLLHYQKENDQLENKKITQEYYHQLNLIDEAKKSCKNEIEKSLILKKEKDLEKQYQGDILLSRLYFNNVFTIYHHQKPTSRIFYPLFLQTYPLSSNLVHRITLDLDDNITSLIFYFTNYQDCILDAELEFTYFFYQSQKEIEKYQSQFQLPHQTKTLKFNLLKSDIIYLHKISPSHQSLTYYQIIFNNKKPHFPFIFDDSPHIIKYHPHVKDIKLNLLLHKSSDKLIVYSFHANFLEIQDLSHYSTKFLY